MGVADAFAFLLGEWRVVRTLHDHRAGAVGVMDGHASVIQSSPGTSSRDRRACYQERGRLRVGDLVVPAGRTLRISSVDAVTVELFLADGQPYIDVDLRSGLCHRVHRCGVDTYAITISSLASDLLSIHWDVSGPHKRYDAVTRLTRCS